MQLVAGRRRMSPFLSLSSEHGTPVPGALCKQPESVREPKVDPSHHNQKLILVGEDQGG